MLTIEIKKTLNELLTKATLPIKLIFQAPHDYHSLKLQILEQELKDEVAYTELVEYVESLPISLKESLFNLEGKKSLRSVWNDLKKGHCIETAAKDLQSILGNKMNQNILSTRPHVSMPTLKIGRYRPNPKA